MTATSSRSPRRRTKGSGLHDHAHGPGGVSIGSIDCIIETTMSETCLSPDEASPAETSPPQDDPMALHGLEAAMFGLANYCPVTLIGTKAIETICGEDRADDRGSAERTLRSNIRLGYGIMLAGLFCPIFWISYFTRVTGGELIWHAAASGLIGLTGLSLAGWYRHQLGRFR